jgi:hypothetical protein
MAIMISNFQSVNGDLMGTYIFLPQQGVSEFTGRRQVGE